MSNEAIDAFKQILYDVLVREESIREIYLVPGTNTIIAGPKGSEHHISLDLYIPDVVKTDDGGILITRPKEKKPPKKKGGRGSTPGEPGTEKGAEQSS